MKLAVLMLVLPVMTIQARSFFNDHRSYLNGDKQYRHAINLLMEELGHIPKESLDKLVAILGEENVGSGAGKFNEDMKEMHRFLLDYIESGEKTDIAALLAEMEKVAERPRQGDQVPIELQKVYDALPSQFSRRYSGRRLDEQ